MRRIGAGLRAFAVALVLPWLVAAMPARAARLSLERVRALRQAALAAPDLPGAADPVAHVESWLLANATLPPEERDALIAQARFDPALRSDLLEIGAFRLVYSSAPRGGFVAWWDPRQRDAQGRPSTGIAAEDAAALGELLGRICAEQGIAVPEAVPYRLDLEAGSTRVRGPEELRWGIVTPSARDRAAVVKLALLEIGDEAFVVEPLAELRACEDRACRWELLDAARRTVVKAGYIPITEALRASAFAGPDDPALASAILVVDHVDRLHPARTLGNLLRSLATAASPKELRRAFFEATGEAPARLDRLIQAELAEWARDPARDPER